MAGGHARRLDLGTPYGPRINGARRASKQAGMFVSDNGDGIRLARHALKDAGKRAALRFIAPGKPMQNEIQRPASVAASIGHYRCPHSPGGPSRASIANREAFLPIQPIDALIPDVSPSQRSRINSRRPATDLTAQRGRLGKRFARLTNGRRRFGASSVASASSFS
jgi:hypothetical protein